MVQTGHGSAETGPSSCNFKPVVKQRPPERRANLRSHMEWKGREERAEKGTYLDEGERREEEEEEDGGRSGI